MEETTNFTTRNNPDVVILPASELIDAPDADIQFPRIEEVTTPVEVKAGKGHRFSADTEPLDTFSMEGVTQRLLGVVKTKRSMLGVVQVKAAGAEPKFALLEIRQTTPQYEPTKTALAPVFVGWFTKGRQMTVDQKKLPGLDPKEEYLFGLNSERPGVGSRVNPTRVLISNGETGIGPFSYMPWQVPSSELGIQDKQVTSQKFVGRVTVAQEAENPSKVDVKPPVMPVARPEAVGNRYRFTFEGLTSKGRMVFSSRDSKGNGRRFLVYQSNSEGSLRVTQGIETDGHIIKGPEYFVYDSQYTQDTQLHPSLMAEVAKVRGKSGPIVDFPRVTADRAAFLAQDFAEQVRTLPLTPGLHARLHRLRPGRLTIKDLSEMTGSEDTQQIHNLLREEVDDLNMALERAGVVPDFSAPPVSREQKEHPHLGTFQTEVYTKVTNGRAVEWHMSTDRQGRVWIERIRFATSEPTLYGTDAELVFSGILTSKPLEYPGQSDALPSDWRGSKKYGKYEYVDITPFLDGLAPIIHYRQAKQLPPPRNR